LSFLESGVGGLSHPVCLPGWTLFLSLSPFTKHSSSSTVCLLCTGALYLAGVLAGVRECNKPRKKRGMHAMQCSAVQMFWFLHRKPAALKLDVSCFATWLLRGLAIITVASARDLGSLPAFCAVVVLLKSVMKCSQSAGCYSRQLQAKTCVRIRQVGSGSRLQATSSPTHACQHVSSQPLWIVVTHTYFRSFTGVGVG
jgi:hypothetical protein